VRKPHPCPVLFSQHSSSDFCISSPDGPVNPGQGNAIATDAPVPGNAQGQSNTHCGQWYSTVEGDLCGTISLAFSITVDDFYFLNPQVDNKCSNLWLNTSYCVAPVGNIATYSGYPTSTPGTVFPKPTPEPTSVPPPVVTPPLSATASGTVDGCLYYLNAFDESLSSVFNLSEANLCDVWAAQADVAVDDLLAWNPSLSKTNCLLQSGKSYCVFKGMILHSINPLVSLLTASARHTDKASGTAKPSGSASLGSTTSGKGTSTTSKSPTSTSSAGGVSPPAPT
jgi:hypothetical protein